MKKAGTMIVLISFLIFFVSCEKEHPTDDVPTEQQDTTTAAVDSSKLPHNMMWNGHYYLLEFDTAYAYYSAAGIYKSITGNAPAIITYVGLYTDYYTGKGFNFYLEGGWSVNVDPYHLTYDAAEAGRVLRRYGNGLLKELTEFPVGPVMQTATDSETVFPQFMPYDPHTNTHTPAEHIEVISFDTTVTHSFGTVANFEIIVTRPDFYMDLAGKFIAQP